MRNVFQKQDTKPVDSYTMAILLNKAIVPAGDVGVEIEVEGNKFPLPAEHVKGCHHPVAFPDLPQWSYVHDGSLRGKDNAEYVLSKPVKFEAVPGAVKAIFTKMYDYGSVLDESNRTSVHVHLNCCKFHFNRLASFCALYFTMEEVLAQWCGDHRVGNLFCLRGKDAPAIVSAVKKFIRSDGRFELGQNLHYAGLNLHALKKLGSLEVRLLRGCTDPDTIINWVAILQRLYELSAEFTDPREICSLFSQNGPIGFFEMVLGDKAQLVRHGADMNDDMIAEAMYEGIRMAQDIAFCRNWDMFKAASLAPDPFGRDARRVLKKMAAVAGGAQPASYNPFTAALSSAEWGTVNEGWNTPQHTQQAPAPSFTDVLDDMFDPEYD